MFFSWVLVIMKQWKSCIMMLKISGRPIFSFFVCRYVGKQGGWYNLIDFKQYLRNLEMDKKKVK